MMEPLQKRLRLYNPADHGNSIAYDSDNYTDLYAEEYTGLEDEQDVQEEEEEGAEQIDPDEQLEQTRAQLDLKLKSKFEAIFEKYGRDFTGIGDEIDLRTGEIVVDNGHLLQMQDERDDGTTKPGLLEAFTQGPDERYGSVELDDDGVDEVHDSRVKLDDMEEDDMILFQNSGAPSGRPKTPSPRPDMPQDSRVFEREEKKASDVLPKTSLPSEHQILAQFGQDLGPKIAKYVAQQRVQDDSIIEPAWRTPGLPLATPGKRPILKSILLQPDIDRSPSPKGAASVWAPKMPPGRPRRDGADAAAVFRGETIIRDRTWFSTGYVSTTVTKKRTERISQSRSKHTISVPLDETLTTRESELQLSTWANLQGEDSSHVYELSEASDAEPGSSGEMLAQSRKARRSRSSPSFYLEHMTGCNLGQQSTRHAEKEKISIKRKRKREPFNNYTKADDEVLLAWVDDILKQGILLWSLTHWHLLAEKHPRHSYLGWRDRYRRQFYNKDANPSIEDDGVKENLENEKDVSRSARQSVTDSQSGRDEYLLSNESANNTSRDVIIDSTISPINIRSQTNTINDCRANSIDLETIDPALHPPLVNEDMKMNHDCIDVQQRLPLSDSSTVDLQSESCMNYAVPSSTTALRESRSRSLQPTMSPNENGPPTRCQEEDLRDAVISENDHEIAALGSSNTSRTAKADAILSTDTVMPTIEATTTKENFPPRQIKQKILDTTYDFSDEEDEQDIKGTHRLSHPKSTGASTPRHSVKRQIIDLTGEDSTVKKGLLNQILPSRSFHKNNQSPISISSASSTSDSDESEEEFNFFLERTPPSDESQLTISNILGPDSFYNLRENSTALPRQSSPGKKGSAGIGERSLVFSDYVMPALNGNPVTKRSTPSSTKRITTLRKSSEDSPDGSIIETPGGTKKRCGENEFRCGKGFCFKCMEG